jgi:peptide/nickel transport system substrate-binding protein
VEWEDHSPVTCAHVKYGVERSFSQLFGDGPKYPLWYLEGAAEYRGPFVAANNNGKGLPAIECVDAHTIRFRLRQSVAEFGNAVALPVFAPVMPEKDTKDGYDRRPFANGPYKVETFAKDKLVLERNPAWDRRTDKIRKAYPDQVVITWSPDVPATTTRLIGSQGEWADSVVLDKDVTPASLQQVSGDPAVDRRVIKGPTAAVRYLAINTRTVRREECRKALAYAIDKRRFLAAAGGEAYGDPATTMISPQIPGRRDFDLYGTRPTPEGSPEQAGRLMRQAADAGQPCATRLRLGYPDTRDVPPLVATVVEAYRRIGVDVAPAPRESKGYQSGYAGNPDSGVDLFYAEWTPDWASGAAVIPPLFDSRPLAAAGRSHSGSTNVANLDNADINAQIDRVLSEPDARRQRALWGELDEKIAGLAVAVPVLYPKALRLAGTNVRGGFIHPQFGQPDLCAMGLATTSA